MHGSGIEVDDAFKGQWAGLSAGVAFIKIEIDGEKFKIASQHNSTGGWESDWQAMVATLAEAPKDCCYNVIRAENDPDKFIFVPFVPDKAPVRKKMLFSSSQGALKSGMGNGKFVKDFFVTTAEECSVEDYKHSLKETKKEDMMTFDEQEAYDSHMESHMAMGDTSSQAIVEVPIDIDPALMEAIKGVGSKYKTVVMGVEGKAETLMVQDASNDTLTECAGKLPADLPRYILHQFESGRGNCLLFIYYCPSKAKPRARMFYSTCKSNVLLVFEKLGLDEPKRIECDTATEINQEEIENNLFPVLEAKVKMSKPKARSKAKFRGAKFSAN
jgi:twinfilin-like protein